MYKRWRDIHLHYWPSYQLESWERTNWTSWAVPDFTSYTMLSLRLVIPIITVSSWSSARYITSFSHSGWRLGCELFKESYKKASISNSMQIDLLVLLITVWSSNTLTFWATLSLTLFKLTLISKSWYLSIESLLVFGEIIVTLQNV